MEYDNKSFIMDMDGVIYYGNKLIDGAKEFIGKLKEHSSKYLFLTNNSSQTPLDLSKKLRILGVDVSPENIHTAALAVAAFLDGQKKGGSAYVIGDPGLLHALHEVGYNITEFNPDYVIMGDTRAYSLEMIQKACKFIKEGARFIGTNPDLTGPSDFGIVPSVGSLTAPIERATGVKPYFIGKPNPLIMRTALRRLGAHSDETIMIGDRMDTDIIAGIETGLETILVLTGVTSRDDVARYPYQPTRICDSIKDIWK
ncbi:MAG: TIGR01457 family HAD-type hydrolase [Spirochaetes bacterium]|nr:TIGR01457 family HAD-type hydrolase [Spirochaetota bacterium]